VSPTKVHATLRRRLSREPEADTAIRQILHDPRNLERECQRHRQRRITVVANAIDYYPEPAAFDSVVSSLVRWRVDESNEKPDAQFRPGLRQRSAALMANTGCTEPVVPARRLLRIASASERSCGDSDLTSRG